MKPALALALALGVLPLAGCYQVGAAGKTDKIEFVSTSTSDGWKYDYYRNNAYPCSISGYQTFVIGTKVGSSDTPTRPLWILMHGGGVGYFDTNGHPQPGPARRPRSQPPLRRLPHRQRTDWQRPRRRGGVPTPVRVLLQPRHLRRLRPARPAQPEHDARRQAAHDQRRCSRPRPRCSTPKRPVLDRQDVPARRQRRLRRVRRRLVDAAAGRPAGRCVADAGIVNPRGSAPSSHRASVAADATPQGSSGGHGPRASRRSPTSTTSPTSWSAAAGSPCRSCTPGAAPT